VAQRQQCVATTNPDAGYATLIDLLWSERRTLDELLCKLIVSRLVHATGSDEDPADPYVCTAIARLRLTEVLRAAEVDALARVTDLPASITLAELADAAPEPWQTLLGDYRAALSTLLSDLASFATLRQVSLADFLA
jgi:hypothetical protein